MPAGSFRLLCARMRGCTGGLLGDLLVTQPRSYRCDLHGFMHHLLLVLLYVLSQAEKDIHFSIGDNFVIKRSARQYPKVIFLTLL